jgi:hypothetical protein
VIVWQRAAIADLDERLEALEAERQGRQAPAHGPARSRPGPPPVSPAATDAGDAATQGAVARASASTRESQRERIERGKAARDEHRAALEKQLDEERKALEAVPPPVLTAERKQALLEGREQFKPGPIEESALPVEENTPLQPGLALQVKYGNGWYAGEVIGFESDGGIHVRYFGWGEFWDEIVPRSDLRLDPHARERAVEKYGAASGNR